MVFKAIGTFIAKSLLDGRIVDMPFSPLFLELVVRGDNALKCASTLSLLHLMKNADKSLFASLSDVFKYAQAKTIIDTNAALSESQKKTALANVTVKDVRIDDLCLDFTLPGYPDVELKSDGTETSISLENVGDYVEKVVDMTVRSGIQRQTQAFREGFNHVFPISRLKCFSVEELCLILGGSHEEDWSFLTIRDSIKADHGFTSDSKTVENLVLMLESFNLLERREFLMFVTGSAKLPIGGFKALNPPLTVVQKGSEFGSQADAYLPSVMTCVNYLKVPAYSDLAVMRQRFGLAMKEGQGSFHLS
ncbi:hypothetical protein BC830DRAFT_618218 [Chytriomyces sp. MP71]|nr:hypothetical protein BC830DRAFT_618218 [Chytriomyces sp. MP71]